jgi:hypothetical protein
MSWLEEERRRRGELEKKRQAKAQKAAEKLPELSNEWQREVAREWAKVMNRFAKHMKKALPREVTIVEVFLNESDYQTRPAVRVDLGNGMRLDLTREAGYSDVTRGVKWASSTVGGGVSDSVVITSPSGTYLGSVYQSGSYLDSGELRKGLYDAYRRLAGEGGSSETHP